jgi:hypothetical protein
MDTSYVSKHAAVDPILHSKSKTQNWTANHQHFLTVLHLSSKTKQSNQEPSLLHQAFGLCPKLATKTLKAE